MIDSKKMVINIQNNEQISSNESILRLVTDLLNRNGLDQYKINKIYIKGKIIVIEFENMVKQLKSDIYF